MDCDILIREATIIDGSGADRYLADVAIVRGKIAAIGQLNSSIGESEIDGGGLILAPGFIDSHTHDDRALLTDPAMTCKVSQGVTTVITGNCGVSLAPLVLDDTPPAPLDLLGGQSWYKYDSFDDYLTAMEVAPASVNAACLIGHSTLRVRVMDDLDRPASKSELAEMKQLLAQSIEAGALGFSTGLQYAPSAAAPTEEVMELSKIVRAYNAVCTTHMRHEEDKVMDAMRESAEICCAADAPMIISHHKVAGPNNYGRSVETLAYMDQLREKLKIGLDAYPYDASSTVLVSDYLEFSDKVQIAWSKPHPQMNGKFISDIAEQWGCSEKEACDKLQPAGAVYYQMNEDDVRRILKYPATMIGSDGLPHDVIPHPRLWGTFPRVLGHYVREVALFSLEMAVHKMTGLTAKGFGLKQRGLIRQGYYADLVLFDATLIEDKATFAQPIQKAEGIHLVVVNGQIVWRDGTHTYSRPGHVLRRPALTYPRL